MRIKKHITNIEKQGISIIPQLISKKKCLFLKRKSLEIIDRYKKLKKFLSSHNQVINSPFRYEKGFYDLIFNRKLDKLLKKLIDKNYVLINTNIINRKIDKTIKIKERTIGDGWHTDSAKIGKEKIFSEMRYVAIVLLDDFNETNGCTYYIPKSHLKRQNPKRNRKYKCKKLIGKAGDVVVFDSCLWHKGGFSSEEDRVSLFTMYGPWWTKSYYNYEKMLGKFKLKKLNKNVRKLLHYNSTPPKNAEERIGTITRY